MKQLTPLRHLAVALLASVNPVLAAPQQVVTTADAAPLPWVTVDPSGGGSTITPKVITTQGHIATVSEAPGNLLSTAIYTLSPNGRASTYTGLAPVAAATGSGSNNEAGVFLACHVNKGVDAPFCQPRRGAALVPGRTYYVTWDPSYFQPSTSQKIQLAASWGTNNNQGSVSEAVPASVGFYAWTIPANFLSSQPGNPVSVAVSLSLQQEDPETPENDRLSIPGPTVFIVNALPDEPRPAETGTPAGGSGTNILAIVLPIILVAVLIGLGAFCFLSYRKHGAVPIVGGPLKRRSTGGGGYGVRQSRSERVGQAGPVDPGPYGAGAGVVGDRKSETDIGVELTDRDSWSPTARSATGRNVFREEVERQERAARGER